MKKILLVVCSLVFVLSSCRSNCVQPSSVQVVFENFDSNAVSILLVKSYVKNTNFMQIVDSNVIIRATNYAIHGDTVYTMSWAVDVNPEKDWLIQLPLASKMYKISDIHYSNDHMSAFVSDYYCYDQTFYKLNGADSSIAAPGYAKDVMGPHVVIVINP